MLREFISDPLGTATIAPSSMALAHAMLEGIDFSTIRSLVEYGPGTGVFTRAALELCHNHPLDDPTGRTFLAIERNPGLAEDLPQSVPSVPGTHLNVVHGDALEVRDRCATLDILPVDLVISGLGWPSIPKAPRRAILEATAQVLNPGGQFRTFGYHIGLCMPGAWDFRRVCRELFETVTISPIIWGNLPPAFVYTCTKAS